MGLHVAFYITGMPKCIKVSEDLYRNAYMLEAICILNDSFHKALCHYAHLMITLSRCACVVFISRSFSSSLKHIQYSDCGVL